MFSIHPPKTSRPYKILAAVLTFIATIILAYAVSHVAAMMLFTATYETHTDHSVESARQLDSEAFFKHSRLSK